MKLYGHVFLLIKHGMAGVVHSISANIDRIIWAELNRSKVWGARFRFIGDGCVYVTLQTQMLQRNNIYSNNASIIKQIVVTNIFFGQYMLIKLFNLS